MPLYQRNGIWWIDLRHRGRRVRRTTGTADKEKAQRQHDELKAKLWQQKQAGRHLADALLIWAKERTRGKSALAALKQIRAEYRDRPLVEVTNASLLDTWGDKKPGTYNRLVNVVRAALNMAYRREWIERPPAFERRKEPAKDARWLTPEEWDLVQPHLPAHLQAMAGFAIATGLRWSNVAGLTWDRVDLAQKICWIPSVSSKARRPIAVPLSGEAVRLLASLPDRTGPCFTYAGRQIKSPKTGWRSALKKAGVPYARWHDLRHTWASWHVKNGTPLPVLQRLGAWETSGMVNRYAHLAPSFVAEYADNSAPKDTRNGHTKS